MRVRLLAICSLIAVFLCATTASGQIARPSNEALKKFDDTVQAYLKKNNIPGALVGIASKGELIAQRSYGLANVEHRVPVSDSTVFEIGSISKQFVVVATMQLVEEGTLDLDDTIHTYLPGLPGEWLGVTIRQLMTHTSGIPDYEEIRTYDVYRFRLTPEDVIRIAQSRPMDFAPGTGWQYSNTGYFLLSMIVERVDGKPLGDVLGTRIFKPLGMNQTRMTDPEDIIPHRASGYWVDRNGALINRNPTETSSTLGAGGILSSLHDMIKWDFSLYGDALISNESKAEMWTPVKLPDGRTINYGYGWEVYSENGRSIIGHSGMVAGFVADYARFPEWEAGVFVFLNRYEVSSFYLVNELIKIYLPVE